MIIRHPELAADIPFPRKRFFGNFNSSMLMKRTQQFRSYFLHILNGKNFKYRNSHIFRDFLISDQDWCLQKPSSPSPLVDDIDVVDRCFRQVLGSTTCSISGFFREPIKKGVKLPAPYSVIENFWKFSRDSPNRKLFLKI